MFRTGQNVVCINGQGWKYRNPKVITTGWWIWKKRTTIKPHGPGYQEVCTITGFNQEGNLFLKGYEDQGAFASYCFRPMDPLMDQLERIEKEGAPATRPEPMTA